MSTITETPAGPTAKQPAIRPAALSVNDAAAYIGVSVSMLWKLNREDDDFRRLVQLFKIGVKTLAPMDGLECFVAFKREQSTALQNGRMRRMRAARAK